MNRVPNRINSNEKVTYLNSITHDGVTTGGGGVGVVTITGVTPGQPASSDPSAQSTMPLHRAWVPTHAPYSHLYKKEGQTTPVQASVVSSEPSGQFFTPSQAFKLSMHVPSSHLNSKLQKAEQIVNRYQTELKPRLETVSRRRFVLKYINNYNRHYNFYSHINQLHLYQFLYS